MNGWVIVVGTIALAGCGGSTARPATTSSSPPPCPAAADTATPEARSAALAGLRTAWPTCRPSQLEAARDLAHAAGVDRDLLIAYLDAGADARVAAERAVWDARAALAAGDAAAALARLDAAAPSPVVLAERARAARAAGLAEVAATALAAAIALARLEQPGDPAPWIPETILPGTCARRVGRAEVLVTSPDGRRFAEVPYYTANRLAIHDGLTGLEVAALDVADVRSIALFDDGRVAVSSLHGIDLYAPGATAPTVLRARALASSAPTPAIAASPRGDALVLIDDTGAELMSVAPATLGETLARLDDRRFRTEPDVVEWRGDTVIGVLGDGVGVFEVADAELRARALDLRGVDTYFLSADGTALVVGERGDPDPNRVVLYDVATGERRASTSGPDPVYVEAVAVVGGKVYGGSGDVNVLGDDGKLTSADHQRIATCGPWKPLGDGRVRRSDGGVLELAPVDGGPPRVTHRIWPAAPVQRLSWTADGRRLAAIDGDLHWLSAAGVHTTPTATVAADGKAAAQFRGAAAELWWLQPDDYGGYPFLLHADAQATQSIMVGEASAFALSSDGTLLFRQLELAGDIEVRDLAADRVVSTIRVPPSKYGSGGMHVEWLAVVDGDRRLVIGDSGSTVVWNLTRKVNERTIDGALLAVSPDGAWLLTEPTTGRPHITDVGANRQLADLPVDEVTSVAFSADSRRVAVGDRQGGLTVLEVDGWKVTATVAAHERPVTSVAWRPDGELVATAGAGGVVRLWGSDGTARAAIALGTTVWSMFEPTTGPPWVALFPDGTVAGPGGDAIALRVGAIPLGLGVAVLPAAPADAWASLFVTP